MQAAFLLLMSSVMFKKILLFYFKKILNKKITHLIKKILHANCFCAAKLLTLETLGKITDTVFVVSHASDSSETVEILIVKLGTVTASDVRMHHVLIILTLTFIQGHTDQNHENNK